MTLRAEPRPGTRFSPLATWADERGYTLSDRIWSVSEVTAARIDALLAEGIAQGRSAVALARDLEAFLNPARRRIVTRTPYGAVGSFDARRLARSEITRASSVSFLEAAARNPFVVRIHHRLSASHDPAKCNGTCDALAAEDQERGGWPVDKAPVLAEETHPNCTCTQWAEVGDVDAQTVQDLSQGRTPALTPLAGEVLVNLILGRFLQDTHTPTPGGEQAASEMESYE